jgi:hypothetical protein
VHDVAGREEEKSFEEGVRDEMKHGGGDRRSEKMDFDPRAQSHEHVAQLTDGRVSEDSLEVMLREGQ